MLFNTLYCEGALEAMLKGSLFKPYYTGEGNFNKQQNIRLVYVPDIEFSDIEDIAENFVITTDGRYTLHVHKHHLESQIDTEGYWGEAEEVKKKIHCWKPQNLDIGDFELDSNDFYVEFKVNRNRYIYTTATARMKEVEGFTRSRWTFALQEY